MTPQSEIAISVRSVYKSFLLPHERHSSIKSALINFKGKRKFETQKVLEDITFDVKKGEFFGIVGRNGSGKSTLLKLLAGIYTPTKGDIEVTGKLTPFIELGVGFNPELTGRENVFLNGALLGFNRKEMMAMYDDIVEFAELEKFMDQKLKNYSSGMQVRLAFSIAIRIESDILVLDEVLAVGDAAFQRKCYDYFMALKKNKQTVILVTHDMSAVRQYCDRAVMIEAGKIVKSGKPEKIAQSYQKLFTDEAEAADQKKQEEGEKAGAATDRWGEGSIKALKPSIEVGHDVLRLTTEYEVFADKPAPIYGFTIFGPTGLNIMENNTKRAKRMTDEVHAGEKVTIEWEIPNILTTGTYTVSLACCDQSTTIFYDWLNGAQTFKVNKTEMSAGTVDPSMKLINYEVQ